MSSPAESDVTVLTVHGMTCASCQIHVQHALESVPGVQSANVNLMGHTAQVIANPTHATPVDTAALISAVRSSGYDAALPSHAEEHEAHHHDESGHLGLRAALALIAGAIAMLLSMMVTPKQSVQWLLFVIALATMVFAAPEIYTAAFRTAIHRTTNMNTLVALGTIAALASSFAATVAPGYFVRRGLGPDVYYEAVVLILAFLLAGRWLEARARDRATSAIRGFAQLESADARLLDLPPDATDYAAAPETLLPLAAIEINDLVRILPGDRIPLDGIIVHGRSSIDESMLTGEPLPVTRNIGDHVSGGTLNLDGPLVVRATAVGAASTLAQMQRLLTQAQSSRAPMQQLADRVSAVFVPSVLVLAMLTFAVWALAENTSGRHGGFALPISIAIAVLIIACPCAMGLAVPAAITVSLGRAAKSGLLIKGGEVLERLAAVDRIAIDKTGTLTEGHPQIAAFQLVQEHAFDRQTLLLLAAAMERTSTHPLAEAVVTYVEQEHGSAGAINTQMQVEDVVTLPGTGLTATFHNSDGRTHSVGLGSAALLRTSPPEGLLAPNDLPHATPLYLLIDDVPQAAFFATDKLRSSARAAISDLAALRVKAVLLTGDTAASAAPIAAAAGIDDIQAHLLPAQKLEAIRALQSGGHKVAMVGDGINDAAALAQSDAGLAMASGTDLAREAGDILLLHHDLTLLPLSIRIARRTTKIMKQNLGWALIYNLIGIPLAAGVLYPHFHILLSPIVASAAMALSSVSVLTNSLRLRRLP